MNKHLRFALAPSLLALACSSSFALDTTSSFGLGTLGIKTFGNTFNQAVTFSDTYTFHIDAASSVGGSVSVSLGDVSISALELMSGSTTLYTINNSNTFTFANLLAGDYALKVSGSNASATLASYSGVVSATASAASPAPEASDALMAAMGLLGVGFWVCARKSK